MISKVILRLAVPGFASAPLLNRGIIITCRKEFGRFPALCWQQPAAMCCYPCFHNSAESVPLKQGQLQTDVTTTLPSPVYLSSRWATYWYSPKKLPKVTEWPWNTSWASAHLLTTLLLQGSFAALQWHNPHAFVLKDPHRDVPFLFWCKESNC